ncbi:MAG TPA: sulfite exporter TauE/SafE family protein [Kofleriaceae bacterium]
MTIAVVAGICFVATLVRSTFGFGESLVAVPLLALVIPIEVAVPLAVLLSVLVAVVTVIQDRASIHFSSAKWLVAFALPGIPIGLAILVYVEDYWVRIGLGVLIILYSAYAALAKRKAHLDEDHKGWLFVCGLLSGVLGGAYGINGPPLVVYGNLRRWSPQHFRATLQAYFLPASAIGLIGYAVKGLLGATVMTDFALCLPATIPAVFLGRYLNSKLDGPAFFKYVYCGLILIGVSLIAFTLT